MSQRVHISLLAMCFLSYKHKLETKRHLKEKNYSNKGPFVCDLHSWSSHSSHVNRYLRSTKHFREAVMALEHGQRHQGGGASSLSRCHIFWRPTSPEAARYRLWRPVRGKSWERVTARRSVWVLVWVFLCVGFFVWAFFWGVGGMCRLVIARWNWIW